MSRYTYLIYILISTGSISDFNQIKCSKDKCGSFVQVQDFCNKYHLDIEKQMFVPVSAVPTPVVDSGHWAADLATVNTDQWQPS